MNGRLLEVLEFFFGCFDVITRRECGLILAGLLPDRRRPNTNYVLRQWARKGWVRKSGHGRAGPFCITSEGRFVASGRDPETEWNRHWDGYWRALTYDVPETDRDDRLQVSAALQERNIGFLQRSVWVWPHDMQSLLLEISHETGAPHAFCGFVACHLFCCEKSDLVRAAWNFEEISRKQQAYLDCFKSWKLALEKAKNLSGLAAVVQQEQEGRSEAFSRDPLLPRRLVPKDYRGFSVEDRHQRFKRWCSERAAEIRSKPV